jgi:hypothetical protein
VPPLWCSAAAAAKGPLRASRPLSRGATLGLPGGMSQLLSSSSVDAGADATLEKAMGELREVRTPNTAPMFLVARDDERCHRAALASSPRPQRSSKQLLVASTAAAWRMALPQHTNYHAAHDDPGQLAPCYYVPFAVCLLWVVPCILRACITRLHAPSPTCCNSGRRILQPRAACRKLAKVSRSWTCTTASWTRS